MEMRVCEDVAVGANMTPPIDSVAFSLYDRHLLSHCSSCFGVLPSDPSPRSSSITPRLRSCSSRCSYASSIISSAAELYLLRHPDVLACYPGDSSDLRASLRLIQRFQASGIPLHGDRVAGLLTNRHKLLVARISSSDENEVLVRIKLGARAMAIARSMCHGFHLTADLFAEEAALCTVLTNAVEVQGDDGIALGIAVFQTDFSWINHSCSPNACYRFVMPSMRMLPDRIPRRVKSCIAPSGLTGGDSISKACLPECRSYHIRIPGLEFSSEVLRR